MVCLLLAAALALQAAPQEEADKAAAELLKKLEERVMKAKTLHVEFELKPADEGKEHMLKGELKIGEGGAFFLKATVNRGKDRVEEAILRSDGRIVVGQSPMAPVDFSTWNPATVQRCLRRASQEAAFLGIYLIIGREVDSEKMFNDLEPKDVKGGGREKVGAVEAVIVTFGLDLKEKAGLGDLTVSLWIDPDKQTVLKRRIEAGKRESLVETTTRFDLNADLPAALFEFQTPALLQEGRAIQLARSVELHARYTGRLPRTLEDLARRPADLPGGVFWPARGFWIGGAIPKDIPFSSDATHFTVGAIKESIPAPSPVAAPTDRLKKFYEARILVQLLKAAAEGHYKATMMMPKEGRDLVKKPEALRFWPEGSWIGGGNLPLDPWGEAFVIRGGGSFSASVANARGRRIKATDVTPEERKSLDDVAFPALDDKEAAEIQSLIQQLGDEALEACEGAMKAILEKGRVALRLVMERLTTEKEPEIVLRHGLIRNQLQSTKAAWELEMKSLWAGYAPSVHGVMMSANERNGSWSLKTITTAQADFRANDRDGNREMDFWVRDVAGLYGLEPAPAGGGEAAPAADATLILKLIEPALASADATEGRWNYPTLAIKAPQAKAGYHFASLRFFESGGKTEPYHKGGGRNHDRFGFAAYPADYGISGRMTFIVNEDNSIWQKDLEGEEIDTFPADPAAAGWRRMD